jgi:hypothetical protein
MNQALLAFMLTVTASAADLENRGIIPASRSRSRAMAVSRAAATRAGRPSVAHVAAPAAAKAASPEAIYTGSTHPTPSAGLQSTRPLTRPKVGRRVATGELAPIPGVGIQTAVTGPQTQVAAVSGGPSFTASAAGSPIGVESRKSQNTTGTGAFVGQKDTAPQPNGSGGGGGEDPMSKILNNIMGLFKGLFGAS